MSNKVTAFLNSIPGGPKGVVSNFKHAQHVFVDNTYRLAPRTKFLYYVVFRGPDKEMSLLVKTAELPKYTMQTVTKNVYNRTKHIYKMMSYDPITFTFHDDNNGVINRMWHDFYKEYNDDAKSLQLYHQNSLVNYGEGSYGMINSHKLPFFQKISLYTLSQQKFQGYELLAPRIKSWTHSNLDYTANEPAENTMVIDYEGVIYSSGSVTYGSPDGFASGSYDVVKSPNTPEGAGLKGIVDSLGGSIISGVTSIFGDVTTKNITERPGAFVSAAIEAVQNYQGNNPGGPPSVSGIVGALSNPGSVAGITNTVGGVLGAAFPKLGTELGTAVATTAVAKVLQPSNTPNTFGPGGGP